MFECPGLLPEGGVGSAGRTPPAPPAERLWQVAAIVAGALASWKNAMVAGGRSRGATDRREPVLAETVMQPLHDDELRVPCVGTFEAPLPADTYREAEPDSLLRFTAPFPISVAIQR